MLLIGVFAVIYRAYADCFLSTLMFCSKVPLNLAIMTSITLLVMSYFRQLGVSGNSEKLTLIKHVAVCPSSVFKIAFLRFVNVYLLLYIYIKIFRFL